MKKSILLLATLYILAAPGFQAQAFTSSRLASHGTQHRLFSNQGNGDPFEGQAQWTLDEDWLLIDQLPQFTVGDGDQTRTFWTQLSAATPRFASKKSSQLYERCQVLATNYTLKFGPSPPLLQNWGMDLSASSRDNRAVGTLENGRVVFLNYHVVGRLAGDTFQDVSSPSVMALIPGGYLEAVGGRIYELGEPRKSTVASSDDRDVFGMPFVRSSLWQDDDDEFSKAPRGHSQSRDMVWWLPGATGTVSAMLASTVLSACIGYGAGLGIIADETAGGHHSGHPVLPSHADVQSVHYKYTSQDTPSLEERTARAEYRILREQRILQKISEQLARDQEDLQGLEKIQFMEQQARASNLMP